MATSGGPNIITDKLILAIDGANQKSYPGTGTTWDDLSGNGNNITLINGPTFNTDNGGNILFDGVNDRMSLTNSITLSQTSDWTLQTWVKSNQTLAKTAYLLLLNSDIGGGANFFLFEWNNRVLARNSSGTAFAFQTGWTPGLPLNNSTFLLTIIGRNGFLEVYSNVTKTTVNAVLSGDLVFNSIMNGNNNYQPGGNLYTFNYYNRALTSEEIQQNYNATKSRFGL